MASFYAQYLMERTDDLIIENDNGFATYRYIEPGTIYIVDIYVSPDVRRTGTASWFADAIVKEAKDRGCHKLIGSVVPSAKNSTISMQVLLGYGMVLDSAANDLVIFRKEI